MAKNGMKILGILSLLVFLAEAAFCLGISVSPGTYFINNLKIGQAYDLAKMSQPLTIRYNGTTEMDMVIEAVAPLNLSEGFEVMPDTSWIKTDKEFYRAMPGESVTTGIFLEIPNDEKHLGRKYETMLRVSLKPRLPEGAMGIAPAALVRLTFTVFGQAAAPDEGVKLREALQKTRNISLGPSELVLENVPLNRRIDVKKEYKKSIKISNLNDEPVNIRLRILTPAEANTGLAGGEAPPPGAILRLSRESFKLKGNQIEEVFLYVNIPPKDEYRDKKYLFIVEAALTSEALVTQYRSRVFVQTK